ncbi:helix-turn-helix domain-containing protein [Isoptericola sp. NPDC019693]|uniref:helix-turn-helix domain-containing protein n=1 Tax=Isoptericola sp. NPDC019693 TaxID=3364009 RepID=UPI00379E869C
MTEEQATPPPVERRIAARLRALRESSGATQATWAQRLTAAGVPTKVATLARIESGQQPIDVHRLLALIALVPGVTMDALLEPPFTIGHLTLADGSLVGELLLQGRHDQRPGEEAHDPAEADARLDQLTAMVTESFPASRDRVAEALVSRFGSSDAAAVVALVRDELVREAAETPEPGTPSWRAYQAHAVRRVGRELAREIGIAAHDATEA